MTRADAEREVAALLLEQRRLARFNLKLAPDALLRLKRLLQRLGWTRGVPMSRRDSVRRYSLADETSFHEKIADDPDELTASGAFADYLQEGGRDATAAHVRAAATLRDDGRHGVRSWEIHEASDPGVYVYHWGDNDTGQLVQLLHSHNGRAVGWQRVVPREHVNALVDALVTEGAKMAWHGSGYTGVHAEPADRLSRRRLRYKKISYAEGAGNPAATTPWNAPPRYEPKPARPPARPQQQPANDAISEDLRTFRQQVRPGHAGGGPGTVRPNTPGERALLAQHAQRRGLKVRRSQYTYYDDATHTLYHPTPGDDAAVGEAYVRMGGGRVKLARTPKPPRPTYSDLVTHAGAVFDNPMDDTAVRAFADHLQEVHGDNPAVQGFVKWTTGEGTIRDIIQHLRETAYRPYGPFNDRSNTAGIDDPDIEFRHRDTGNSYAKGQGEGFWHRRENMRGKRGGPRTENDVARLETRRVRGPRMTGADVAHAIYTEAGPESLINSVIGARYYHPDRTGPKTGELDTVKMRRRVVKYVRPDEMSHNGLIEAIKNEPDDATPRLAFADFLQENGIPGAHVTREHAQGILEGTRTSHVGSDTGHMVSRIMVLGKRRRYGGTGLATYNDRVTGETRELPLAQVAYGPGSVRLSVSHVANPSEVAEGHSTGTRITHGVAVRDIEHLHHLTQDFPQWARQEIERVIGSSLPPPTRMQRRVVRYAKADTRHVAHPLIHGFPLEHFLRHLANDASATSQLRDTAKHVLTTGDSSGLWGLNDLLQEHENGDGTTGHPALKAGYNLMSAADKLQLDRHVHDALHEEAERVRTRLGLPFNKDAVDSAVGNQANIMAWDYDNAPTHPNHQGRLKRLTSRVYSLSGEKDPKKIEESVRRHAARGTHVWRRDAGIDVKPDAERAINAPDETNKNEVATRYARLTIQPGEPLMGGSDFMHAVHDEGGNRVGHVWVTPMDNGERLHVNHVGATGHAPNATGVSAVRDLYRQLKTIYPNAKKITGTRVSGAARANTGTERPTEVKMSRRPLRYMQPSNYTHADFHAKIAENPKELTNHLVYADWLEEQGQPHAAEIIRRWAGKQNPNNVVFPRTAGNGSTVGAVPFTELNGRFKVGWWIPHAKVARHGLAKDHINLFQVDMSDPTYYHQWYVSPVEHEDAKRLIRGLHAEGQDTQGDEKLAADLSPKKRRKKLSRVIKYAKPNRSDFLDALRRLKSSNHTALTGAAADVANRMGVGPTKVLAALHDTPHGSVPGVAQAVYSDARPESVHALAAWVNGLLPNGPGYAVFHARDNGPDTLYRVRHEGSGMDVRVRLDRVGITSRVLVPHRKGFDVLVPDKGNKLAQNVAAYAQQHGLSVEASAGHFQTVGSSDQGQARARFRDKVVAGERRQQMSRRNPKRYAEVPTNPGEEWVKDFKVPVSYDSPNGDVGVAHYAPKRHAGSGRWVWSRLEHLGFVPDHETAKRMFPNVMHEDEFFNEHKTRGFGSGHADEETHNLTPEEIYLATDGREGTPPAPSEGTDWRPNETIPEDYYALSRRRRSPCRS